MPLAQPEEPGERGAVGGTAALAAGAGVESATSAVGELVAPAPRLLLAVTDAPPARSVRSRRGLRHFFFLRTHLLLHHHQGSVGEQG